jgi:hypothetical protein
LFVFLKNKQDPNKQSSDQSGHQCTAEAKICPDGSSVSRTGSTCEFAPCPTSIVQNSAPSPILTPSSDNFAYGSIASTGDVDSKYTAEKNRYIGNLEMKPQSAITDSSTLNNSFVLKSKSLLQERGFTESWLKDHATLVFFRENSLDGDLQQTPKRSRAIWQLAIGPYITFITDDKIYFSKEDGTIEERHSLDIAPEDKAKYLSTQFFHNVNNYISVDQAKSKMKSCIGGEFTNSMVEYNGAYTNGKLILSASDASGKKMMCPGAAGTSCPTVSANVDLESGECL